MWYGDKLFGKCYRLEEDSIKAVIAPEMGMSLVDFSVEDTQILDVSRTNYFLKYRKGLGPLILPHFNEEGFVPEVKESDFPHIKYLKEDGVKHPFQHGIGRYVKWKAKGKENSITGFIEGSMTVSGYTFKELAGFNFKATVSYTIREGALEIYFSISGDKPVVFGIHYYYNLVNRDTAKVEIPRQDGGIGIIRFNRNYNDDLKPASNFVTLTTDKYSLETTFKSAENSEDYFNSVVIFSPENESFVCIEPLSYMPGVNSGTVFLKPLRYL